MVSEKGGKVRGVKGSVTQLGAGIVDGIVRRECMLY